MKELATLEEFWTQNQKPVCHTCCCPPNISDFPPSRTMIRLCFCTPFDIRQNTWFFFPNEMRTQMKGLSWSFKTIMNLIRYPFFNWDSGKHRSKWNVLSTPKVNHKKLLLLTYTGHGVWVRNKPVSEKSKLFVTATNPIPHSRWCRNITLETRTYEKTRILTKEFLSWSSNEVLKSAGQGQ